MPEVTISEQIEEVERELKMRRSVYGRAVFEKRMKQAVADDLTRKMEAVKASLERYRDGLPCPKDPTVLI